MDPKPRPNHQLYLDALGRTTPEQRLLKAFELTELSREFLRAGLRQRFPDAGGSGEVRCLGSSRSYWYAVQSSQPVG